jgi:hypothetical protein
MLAFAVHAFAVRGCPPVLVAPGNHDPWFAGSPEWSDRLLAARGFAWPAHVHVFGTARWSARSLPGRPIRVWGRCYTAGIPSTERPLATGLLADVPAPNAAELDLGLFHGSLEGFLPAGQKTASPFTDGEALRAPFAYLAVGHYHLPLRLEDQDPGSAAGVRLAYAGSAVALEARELGRHGALEVRIVFGEGRPRVEVEPLPLDPRTVHEVVVDVTGAASADQIDHRIGRELDRAGVGAGDIVTARLAGRLMRGVQYGGPGTGLETRAFHLRTDARAVRPDYDLDAYRSAPPATTEERFVQALLARLDAEPDPEERAVIESALYYGLDAFRLRDVSPAYEELGA